MKLDFTMLSAHKVAQPMREPRGQAGTVGTPASMRISGPPDSGDTPGTGGDGIWAEAPYRSVSMPAGGSAPMSATQASPPCPRGASDEKINEINVFPVSPLVPGVEDQFSVDDEFESYAGDHHRANVERDGSTARAGFDQVTAVLPDDGLAADAGARRRNCAHRSRRKTCLRPVEAGLTSSFEIVWCELLPDLPCSAFEARL